MSTWNVEETRKLVLKLYGKRQFDFARSSLRSVIDRQHYARYHYHEAKDLLEVFLRTRLQSASLWEVIFADQEDEIVDNFQVFITKIGAHVTACVQSMHAVGDILGHAIYYSLALNLLPGALEARKITANSVLNALGKSDEFSEIYVLFKQLCTEGSFPQLAALVNHSKHRSIVLPALNEDQTGLAPQRHTLKLSDFEYEGGSYPSIGIKDFLEPEYNRCSILVIKLGNCLNAVLRARASNL